MKKRNIDDAMEVIESRYRVLSRSNQHGRCSGESVPPQTPRSQNRDLGHPPGGRGEPSLWLRHLSLYSLYSKGCVKQGVRDPPQRPCHHTRASKARPGPPAPLRTNIRRGITVVFLGLLQGDWLDGDLCNIAGCRERAGVRADGNPHIPALIDCHASEDIQ